MSAPGPGRATHPVSDRAVEPAAEPTADRRIDLSVDLAPRRGGLRLRHPILVAAGGAGFGNELLDSVGDLAPGAVVTRSISLAAPPGRPGQRMVQLPDALLWALGPQSGAEAVLRRHAPGWGASAVPVIVSICADTAEDIASLARLVDAQPEVAALELPLACPDRSRRGRAIQLDVTASELATVAARAATDLPLVVKLGPDVPDLRDVARAVVAAGADALAAVGPLPGLVLRHDRSGPALGATVGGLSGPALRPIGLRVVYELAQAVRVPIIGGGGVSTLGDVLDHLAAGASAVSLGVAALAEPDLPGRLARELAAWCGAHGVPSVGALVGTALPARRERGRGRSGPRRS